MLVLVPYNKELDNTKAPTFNKKNEKLTKKRQNIFQLGS